MESYGYNAVMSKTMSLTGAERAWLRKQAHHLKPVVMIGHSGVSDAVEKAVKEAIEAHELIKIKFYDLTEEKRSIMDHLASITGAAPVGIIGNVGILFRQSTDPSKVAYSLPKKNKPATAPKKKEARL